MKTLKILSLILITLLSISCGRDDVEPTPQPTTKDYLISGKWFMQSATFGTATECDRKSYYIFNSDGTFVFQTFAINSGVCVDQGFDSGTYTLTDDKILTVIVASSTTPFTWEIVSINQETLGLQTTLSGGDTGIVYFDKTEG